MQYNKLPYALVTANCSITSGREHLRSFSLALKKKNGKEVEILAWNPWAAGQPQQLLSFWVRGREEGVP